MYNTKEMIKHFHQRTGEHIHRVVKFGMILYNNDPEKFKELPNRLQYHDHSKFQKPERTPYICLNWKKKYCNDGNKYFKFNDRIEYLMNKATEHHILNNPHHPEYHQNKTTNLIDLNNRDEGNQLIDATNMTDLDIAEMVADWMAMGEELGNSAKEWADKVIDIRWKFNNHQKDLIHELINIGEK